MIYSKTVDEEVVQNQLDQWAAAGSIKILKPLAECEDMEPYIR